jgi:hypothetical protein
VIVKIPHVGDVDMDPAEASDLADDIRFRLHVEIPLAMAGVRYPREDVETAEPLPATVDGYALGRAAGAR